MGRKILAVLALAALLVSSATGFDTYWHSQCSQKVGEQFGFTEDAWKIMQLDNFSPDFFGPVSEYASKSSSARNSMRLISMQRTIHRCAAPRSFSTLTTFCGATRISIIF
jgi:hypothetical protein